MPHYNEDSITATNNKRCWFLSAVTSLSVWMTAGHARRAVGAVSWAIRFQQQQGIQHWTAAPFSVMWRQRACLQCSCACLSTYLRRTLHVLLGCYDLLRSHYCWTKCTSAESTNLFSGPYYCIHVHVHPVYTYPALASPWKIGIHDLSRVITESALYLSAL